MTLLNMCSWNPKIFITRSRHFPCFVGVVSIPMFRDEWDPTDVQHRFLDILSRVVSGSQLLWNFRQDRLRKFFFWKFSDGKIGHLDLKTGHDCLLKWNTWGSFSLGFHQQKRWYLARETDNLKTHKNWISPTKRHGKPMVSQGKIIYKWWGFSISVSMYCRVDILAGTSDLVMIVNTCVFIYCSLSIQLYIYIYIYICDSI